MNSLCSGGHHMLVITDNTTKAEAVHSTGYGLADRAVAFPILGRRNVLP
jgi:hypothetical protein